MTHLGLRKSARVDEEWLFEHGETDSYILDLDID